VGRYISVEKLIEQNKERYYQTLEQSSAGWRQVAHDPWPYIGYILSIFKLACEGFEDRVGRTAAERGAKTELIKSAIDHKTASFLISQLQIDCPGVSIDMIRRVLKQFRASGWIECLGRGQKAKWQKTDEWQLGNE
jgi:hypothetical protein